MWNDWPAAAEVRTTEHIADSARCWNPLQRLPPEPPLILPSKTSIIMSSFWFEIVTKILPVTRTSRLLSCRVLHTLLHLSFPWKSFLMLHRLLRVTWYRKLRTTATYWRQSPESPAVRCRLSEGEFVLTDWIMLVRTSLFIAMSSCWSDLSVVVIDYVTGQSSMFPLVYLEFAGSAN